MKSIIYFLSFLSVALAATVPQLVPSFVSDLQSIAVDTSSIPEEKIINGAKSDPIPFIVSLQWPREFGWEHFCGGTLITPNRILTAYHCLPPTIEYTRFLAVLGTTLYQQPGQQVEFGLEHIKRDNYRPRSGLSNLNGTVYHANDNIVIQLPSSVIVDNQNVSTVCLAGGEVSADKYYAAGWGFYKCYNERSTYLRYAEAQVLDHKACEKAWRDSYLARDLAMFGQTCSFFKQADGSDTPIYSGDSGGPLVAVVGGKPVQVGIGSFVDGKDRALISKLNTCINLSVPPIFSKVSDHQAFIKKHAPEAVFC